MNRCQRQVLLSFGVSIALLAAFGIVGAVVAAPTGWAVAVILLATGLMAGFVAFAFATAWGNCARG